MKRTIPATAHLPIADNNSLLRSKSTLEQQVETEYLANCGLLHCLQYLKPGRLRATIAAFSFTEEVDPSED